MNKQNNISLLASVAIFKKLFNENKDIYDIIAEFIKNVIFSNHLYIFSLSQIHDAVCSKFNFDIPESVFKTTLKKRLKDLCKQDTSIQKYYVQNTSFTVNTIPNLANKEQQDVATVIDALKSFLKQKKFNLSEDDAFEKLKKFLLGENIPEKVLFSEFVLSHQNDPIKNIIDEIKEGLIIYTGIRYSPNIGQNSGWPTKLTIYLDTEIIFNICGFNGDYHKQKTIELINYIKELNSIRNQISLKYFTDTKDIIENFFISAISEIKNQNIPVIQSSANEYIHNYCKDDPSKVIELKSKLYQNLQNLSIIEENIDLDPNYNLVSAELLDRIRKSIEDKAFGFDEKKCLYILNIYSKIYQIRGCNTFQNFANVNHVLLTETSFAKYIAYDDSVNIGHKFLATDEDFLINKFWFKLNKGLGNQNSKPINFDVLIQAKIIISTQLSDKIYKIYEELQTRADTGKISIEELKSQLTELHTLHKRPEDINQQDFPVIDCFLKHKDVEDFIAMNAEKERKIQKGDKAIKILDKIRKEKRNAINYNKLHKKKMCSIYSSVIVFTISILFCGTLYFILEILFYLGQFISDIAKETFFAELLTYIIIVFILTIVSFPAAKKYAKAFYKLRSCLLKKSYTKFISKLDYRILKDEDF